MSILIRFQPPSLTSAQYDESIRQLQKDGGGWPPEGMELHVCFGSDGNLRVSEVWDSQEQWQAFGERLMPLLADVGIEPGTPEVHEVHNVVKR